jgi:hypothetical protein
MGLLPHSISAISSVAAKYNNRATEENNQEFSHLLDYIKSPSLKEYAKP